MDDFEKSYHFDWKTTPLDKHPNGYYCQCPKHEFQREQISNTINSMIRTKQFQPLVYRCCNVHYDNMLMFVDSKKFLPRMQCRLVMKLGIVKIIKLPSMGSQLCDICRINDSGGGMRIELPPAK